MRATYDAAAATQENSRHWVHADALSAKRANAPGVRKVLRERSRYEVANNSYAQGIVHTLANNLVGTGPRLQVLTSDDVTNRQVERAWGRWAKTVRLADKLRTAKQAKTTDGEAFALLTNNPLLPSSVQLDVRLVECDQVTTPFLSPSDPLAVDGMRYDEYGNVIEYHVLTYHPGDWYLQPRDYRRLPPRSVIHWFRRDRPGQCRGIPEITAALPLFAQLRRFTLATLTAAETAAAFAAMLETTAPPGTDPAVPDPFETLEIERGMMTQLPFGMKLSQLRAEHPATTYEMFVWCLLREICRCLNLPLNVALGDSSKSNFSSARLDHLVYRQAVAVEREDCEREVLEPILAEWLDEATRIEGLLPSSLPAVVSSLPHVWHWPAWEPIDQKVEAEADEIRLRSGSTTLAAIAGEHGADWRELIRQQVREEVYRQQVRAEMGVQAPAPEQEVASAA